MFFSLEKFSSVKNSFAKILVRLLRLYSLKTKSEFFHPFEVLVLHEFFFLRSGDGLIDCEMVEIIWREREREKKGTMQNNTWQCACVFWEELCCLAKLPTFCLINLFPLRQWKLATFFWNCFLLEVKLRPPNLPHWNDLLLFLKSVLRQFLFKECVWSWMKYVSLKNSLAV